MARAAPAKALGIAILFMVMPAAAQNYGPQPGYPPQPSQPTGTPSIIGTWSGTATGTSGQIQIAEAYNPDGTFVSVGRLSNGFIVRAWGTYRLSPAGPNQFRLESQSQGWLPRETCQQLAGNAPQCQPMQLPATGLSLISFTSPDQFQSVSQTEAGSYSVEQRDNRPVLLHVQAPQRWTTITQPSEPAPPVGSVAGGYTPTYRPAPSRPYMNGCPGDDGARIRCRYSGRLVPSGGCLQCVD